MWNGSDKINILCVCKLTILKHFRSIFGAYVNEYLKLIKRAVIKSSFNRNRLRIFERILLNENKPQLKMNYLIQLEVCSIVI